MLGQILLAIASVAIIAVASIINYGEDMSPESTNLPQVTSTPLLTNSPIFTPKPTPTEISNVLENVEDLGINNTLNTWLYPGSEIAENRAGFLLLTTGDNPSKVTAWYKQKVNDLNMNATSVITTTTNDKTLNVISAAGDSGDVKIEITSGEGGGSQITVEY